MRRCAEFAVVVVACASAALGSVFGDVRGTVRDAQDRPIAGAVVTLRARSSAYALERTTDASGDFAFRAVPAGQYRVGITAPGFAMFARDVAVTTGSVASLDCRLEVSAVTESVDVRATDAPVTPSPTPSTIVTRDQIERTPGADRTNSLAMIVNFIPGAYVTHDQLHVSGGHQVTWTVDGVPVANTNIASNVGPQFDPKDVDLLETERGAYSAESGDRTYAVFNIVPRTGFERSRSAEVVATYGSFNQTNDQISFGDHSRRAAWYLSANANRTDYGLAAPGREVAHDLGSGGGVFGSFVFDATPKDQLRIVGASRGDHYQVPIDVDDDVGIRDIERESDAFVNLTWAHTFNSSLLLTVSPFYHFNRADYEGGPSDTPVIPRDERGSYYAGAQVVLGYVGAGHNAKAGFYGFAQHDRQLFGLRSADPSGPALEQTERVWGNLEAAFVEDQYSVTPWLVVTGGLRYTHFGGPIDENVASPRAGVALRIPRSGVTLRGFYGRYYQAPPLLTVSGPLAELAVDEGFAFLPLRGERDEEYLVGADWSAGGWAIDGDYFHTSARNYFDHEALGDSNIFFPLTIDRARLKGVELSLRSPRLYRRLQLHAAYAHLRLEGQGAVSGGLTDFEAPEGVFFLDHDQTHTLSVGGEISLPATAFVAGELRYGSGFLDGEGPNHLPGHTVVDASAGKRLGENWSLAVHATNITNRRFLLDNSETFGGTHFSDPRQVYVEARYRFHF